MLATCLMAALTYVLTTWLLLSITYVEPVEQESIVDFSVAAEASGLDDRVPLDWVGKRIEVFWPRNALWSVASTISAPYSSSPFLSFSMATTLIGIVQQ